MEKKMRKIGFCACMFVILGLSSCKNSTDKTVQQGQSSDSIPENIVIEEEVMTITIDSISPDTTTNTPKTNPSMTPKKKKK